MRVTISNAFFADLGSAAGSELYRIFVYVPEGPPPVRGWPMLCLTDGNAVFGMAVDAMRAQAADRRGSNVAEGVVVAIGYPTDRAYDSVRRAWDLSPPPGSTYPPYVEGGPVVRTGGGLVFLRFIEADLLPWLATRVPIDPQRRTLFGHSFGGLFALLTLFTRPALFDTYVPASPSLYWEDFALRSAEDAFFAAPDRRALRVFLSAGEYEGDRLAPFHRGRADEAQRLTHHETIGTVRHARALADRFDSVGSATLQASYETFAGETHMSVLPVAIGRAVQAAFEISSARLEL